MSSTLCINVLPQLATITNYPLTRGPTVIAGLCLLTQQKLPTDAVGNSSLTLTNVPIGTELRIRQGSYTLLHVQDTLTDPYVYNYQYYSSPTKVKIQFTLPGYVFEDLELSLYNIPITVQVIYNPDPSYI